MTQEQRGSPGKPERTAIENYSRAQRLTDANWLLWLSAIYMPFGLYPGFVVQPVVWLFGASTNADPQQLAIAQFTEILVWIALPLLGAIVVYYSHFGT